ncbi:hypothetical protein FA10DRAFT_99088 [Acaromyces ingoldii]|uniref:RRM domain-containing protein n=1 Tax=Acaromyces ingoldii TaxID=215250 RepID=A0A316YQ40_9BASI|nr:hypothetical protein FA10DRAFT_99088 [Acaromyces ingoldii]PWN89865.1 hypothetical protein FA10DRAFT_99088 [Acaromyces ingoldii]
MQNEQYVGGNMMDMMKRSSSQSHDGSGGPGEGGSMSGLEGLTRGAAGTGDGDGISKKARFVSEGNIHFVGGGAGGTGTAALYGAGAGTGAGAGSSGAPPPAGPGGSGNGGGGASGGLVGAPMSAEQMIDQQQQQQQQQQWAERGFSNGATSPYLQHHQMQQAAANAGAYGSNAQPIVGGSFSPLPPHHHHLQQQHGSPMANNHMFPAPTAFGSSPPHHQQPPNMVTLQNMQQMHHMQNMHPMAGFMPNVGLLTGAPGPPPPPPPQANATGRTVYVGNLPADASVDELLNQVKFGPIDNVRVLPDKSCAFISFLDGATAAAFHADASVKKMSLHNQELKIGWGKPSVLPPPILMAVQQAQATRNVYLGQLDDNVDEQMLKDDLGRFGPIDQVKIVRDKNIGFVHFLSIATAIKVVSTLPTEPAWAGKRVNYGKDRCAYVPKSQQNNQAHNSQAAAMGMAAAASLGYPAGFTPSSAASFGGMMPGAAPPNLGDVSIGSTDEDSIRGGATSGSMFGNMMAAAAAAQSGSGHNGAATAMHQLGNRTVYLGNIHPDTTTEEICNHVRGGVLQNVRYIPEKHIAFITFVDPNAALAFYHLANYSGVMIHNRRLKIGWGKHSGPLSPAIAMAVQAGGSRNVYVGNIEDFDFHTIEKLRRDFGEYGDIEMVNQLREKSCAFVNFCNIQNAIKAIEAMKNHPDYPNQRIGAGKDRCGNPPRAIANQLRNSQSPPPHGGMMPSSSSGNLSGLSPSAAASPAVAAGQADQTPQQQQQEDAAGSAQAAESEERGTSQTAMGAIAPLQDEGETTS